MAAAQEISHELWVCHLGSVPYRAALAIQEDVRARRQAGELPDALLLLEHPPVYTRGRRSRAQDLPFPEAFYRAKSIEVIDTDRGGKLTYHGPGQLIGYPIMAVDDIGRYLRTMEDAIVAALAEEGVSARSRHDEGIDYTGVWVGERKIASIGLHVSRGVTTHGFAVNVDNDLDPFSWVVACGLPDVAMTSIAAELSNSNSRPADYESAACASSVFASASGVPCFRKRMAFHFAQAHGRRQRLVSPWRLGIATANPPGLAQRVPIKTISSTPVEALPA
jgi:lipoyl(octanoyl) transferase